MLCSLIACKNSTREKVKTFVALILSNIRIAVFVDSMQRFDKRERERVITFVALILSHIRILAVFVDSMQRFDEERKS